MTAIRENIEQIKREIGNVQLVVVSKYRELEELAEVLDSGHVDLGENRVQELLTKQEKLPDSVHWHVIGHLQRNKVKYIIPFVHLIHSVDSIRLLNTIQKEAEKENKTVRILLQAHIASEESKYGFPLKDLDQWLKKDHRSEYPNVEILGLMGMATLTDNEEQIRSEFESLRKVYDKYEAEYGFKLLSMGMSSDYKIAISCGSNMVRIGSAVFR